MTSTEAPNVIDITYLYGVKIWLSSCTKAWRFPDDPADSFDRLYIIKSKAIVIDFEEVDLTNCPH